ncbi:acyl carrier protein [Sinosporangium siamense]|uniref:Carrier domain-containing protein n=1 Tax=Sinosporangium siamense TaxID=1367973 RepID=A0A919VG57_9ACTN|nr:acyl carrier protein [Sinosporangium siamense]GII96769.1 hypothetical protein Ssi02_70000 [Sinosporangium siamense]
MARPEQLTAEYLRGLFARHLRISPHNIDLTAPLDTFGLDSLTIASMSVTIQEHLGVGLLMNEFSGDLSLEEIARRLTDLLQDLDRCAGEERDRGT